MRRYDAFEGVRDACLVVWSRSRRDLLPIGPASCDPPPANYLQLQAEKRKSAALQEELRKEKGLAITRQLQAEAEEERLTNKLMQRLDELKKVPRGERGRQGSHVGQQCAWHVGLLR